MTSLVASRNRSPGTPFGHNRRRGVVVEAADDLDGMTQMQETVRARRGADPDVSYSARLMADRRLIQRKIMEEAFEVCLELAQPSVDLQRLDEEVADLVYHVTVALVEVGSSLEAVDAVLRDRLAP
jgi:phosphoribosyl-ATP pyrophosphohydrolase